ncbi:hypothetical protein SEUCBS139899_001744 [Sporothrix eucalyptigena]|uniref:RING-type domain-containing protein n=1 Tax=Sporothrix eucalyptigena TaxID=1812306 RepID=A0ABP0BXD9_9PEZI
MAEQCIVCLDQLRAVEAPPPPPLPDDSGSAPKTSNASTSTAVGPVDSDTAPIVIGTNGPSTAVRPASPGLNGHSGSHDADDAVGEAHIHDVAGVKDAAKEHEETHDDDHVAVIDVCKHTLHDTCLRAWATKANSCPICRQSFHLVDVYDKIGEGVPEGAWFCMECVDSLGDAIPAPVRQSSLGGGNTTRSGTGRRTDATRSRNFFPRTRHTMRRARRRARSDEWQGAWSQITGHVWDAIHIDLDHDEDEALEEFRRIERLHDQERREFERWQERLDIARRLGAQDIFERNIPDAILNHANRHSNPSPSSSSNPRAIVAAVQQSQQERRAWGDFDRAIECDSAATATPNPRKRKSRSHTASPIEPPREQERKLKRPRTRRIGAPAEGVASSSRPPPSAATPSAAASSSSAAHQTLVRRPSAHRPTSSSRPPSRPSSRQGLSVATPSHAAVSPAQAAHSPTNGEPPSFLSSLLKEVEMGTSSDDDNIRSLFGDPPLHAVDPVSPAGSSPSPSAYNSPRAMSTTPPPQRTLRPSSPTLLSSHILPVYPPANYSPTRPSASSSGAGAGSGGENSDSEGSVHPHNHSRANRNNIANGHANSNGGNNNSAHQHRSPGAVEIRQPRPRRMSSAAAVTRSLDSSPTRNALPLEMKESISSIVRSALKPHWKSSHLTADQYAAINRDVSRKLYEEVTNPAVVDTEARKLWEQKANREVERAVADLQA